MNGTVTITGKVRTLVQINLCRMMIIFFNLEIQTKKQKIVHLHKSPARFNLNLKLVYYRFSYWKFDHLKLIQCYFSVVCMIAFSFMH